MPFVFHLMTIARIAVFSMLCIIAGCSSDRVTRDLTDLETGNPKINPSAAEQVGSGEYVVGLLVINEESSLSNGLPNSAYLAGKMAAETLVGTPVTLVIRSYDRTDASLTSAVSEIIEAGANIIIGPDTQAGAASISTLLNDKYIPVISLGRSAAMEQGLYAAGMSYTEEATHAVNEMKRRGYDTITVASTSDVASRLFANAIILSATNVGIKTAELDISDRAAGLAAIGRLALPGSALPAAITFATDPIRSATIISALRSNQRFAEVEIVGNSSWTVAPHSIPHGSGIWYTALAGNALKDFCQKFKAANGLHTTLRGAMVYDLVVMAGVLPQVVSNNPYDARVLTNDQGFKGQTGTFKFSSTGIIQRSYIIVESN